MLGCPFFSCLAVAAYFLLPSTVANDDLPSAAAAAQPIRRGVSDWLSRRWNKSEPQGGEGD